MRSALTALLLLTAAGCQRPLLGDVAGDHAIGSEDLAGGWRIWLDAPTPDAEPFLLHARLLSQGLGRYDGWITVIDSSAGSGPNERVDIRSQPLWNGDEFELTPPSPIPVPPGANLVDGQRGELDLTLSGTVDGEFWCGVADGTARLGSSYDLNAAPFAALNADVGDMPNVRPTGCD